MFSVLNSNVLVYNYIYYPAMLTEFSSVYFRTKESMKGTLSESEFGNYLSIIDC